MVPDWRVSPGLGDEMEGCRRSRHSCVARAHPSCFVGITSLAPQPPSQELSYQSTERPSEGRAAASGCWS